MSCVECARYHRGNPPKRGALKPFVTGAPWEIVSIDICGPFPKSERGNKFVITLVDHFSKYAEAYCVPNHTADVVASEFMNGWVARFGTPMQLLSDQGAEFESNLFQQLCKYMDIDKLRTSPYKPSTNAIVERFHRSLNGIMSKIMHEHERTWDDFVPFALSAYRNSVHESTNYTPNHIIFGHEVNNPIDIVLGQMRDREADENEESFNSMNDYVATMQDRMRCAYALVRQQLSRCAERRKKQYDLKVKPEKYKEGDFVYYFSPRKIPGRCTKWAKNYSGPHLIIRIIEPLNAVIQKSKQSKPVTVHIDKLKPYRGPEIESWIVFPTQCHEEENVRNNDSVLEMVGEQMPTEILEMNETPPEITPSVEVSKEFITGADGGCSPVNPGSSRSRANPSKHYSPGTVSKLILFDVYVYILSFFPRTPVNNCPYRISSISKLNCFPLLIFPVAVIRVLSFQHMFVCDRSLVSVSLFS